MASRTLSEEEFNAIKDRVLQAAPTGLSEQEFTRWSGPAMAQAIGEAENAPAKPTSALGDSAVGRGVSNFVNSAVVEPVKGLLNAAPIPQALGGSGVVQGPVNAVKGLWQAHEQQYEKAKDLAKQGRYTEAAGHALATLVPILGPAAANAGERIASGDIAGGLGAGAGLLAPFAAKYGLELKDGPDPRRADLLRREAEQTVSQRVLAPGNSKFKGTAERIAPDVLARGLQGSRLELQQLADEGMVDAGAKIDAASKARAVSGPFNVETEPIVQRIQDRIDALSVDGKPIPTAASKIVHLKSLQAYLTSLGKQVPFEELRKVRDDFYRAADEAKGYQGPDVNVPDVGWAAREGGSAIRAEFAKDRPELVGPNADFTFYRRLGDVLDPTIGRPKNVTAAPGGVTGGQGTAGAIIGAAATAGSHVPGLQGASALVASRLLPALLEARNSPSWQLAKAADKMKLADAIERGDYGLARSRLITMTQAVPRQTDQQGQP